jgi:hypothetical protein
LGLMQIEGSKRMRLGNPQARKTDEAGSGFQVSRTGSLPAFFHPRTDGIRNCGTGDALLVRGISAAKWSHREVRWVLSLTL